MLRRLPRPDNADLLVGSDTSDDAAVWRRPDGRALVATADFFTPIVDDAFTWGRIAAANAVSDVYAMGGTPLFGLNLVAWPNGELSLDLLGDVMLGGADAAAEGGWVVAGGHTVDGPEPMYGMSMTGEVDPAHLLTNAGGRAGQVLVLTKPLGTGLLATAVKRSERDAVAAGGALHDVYEAGVREMGRLNDAAAAAARAAGATTATDVTGFGLLGHLHELASASGRSSSSNGSRSCRRFGSCSTPASWLAGRRAMPSSSNRTSAVTTATPASSWPTRRRPVACCSAVIPAPRTRPLRHSPSPGTRQL